MKTDLQHLDTEINAHPAANAIRRVPRIQRPRRMIATVLLRCEKCFPQGAIDISALLHDSFCFDACEVGVLNHLCVTSGRHVHVACKTAFANSHTFGGNGLDRRL